MIAPQSQGALRKVHHWTLLATCLHSKLVEGPLAFDSVELLGFPVDALLDHFEAVGRGLEQVLLRAGSISGLDQR